jgi:hypothetical protein
MRSFESMMAGRRNGPITSWIARRPIAGFLPFSHDWTFGWWGLPTPHINDDVLIVKLEIEAMAVELLGVEFARSDHPYRLGMSCCTSALNDTHSQR